MRSLANCIGLFIYLAAASPSLASGSKCDAIFGPSLSRYVGDQVFSVADLDPRVQNWLDFVEAHPERLTGMQYAPGDEISVNFMRLPVVARLGKGAEAYVYLASSPQGLVVVKIYRNFSAYGGSVDDYKSSQILPRVLANDDARQTLVLQYRDGIPVYVLLSDLTVWANVRMDAGIGSRDLEQIRKQWGLWSASHPDIIDVNVVYSFRTHQFYPIDPH